MCNSERESFPLASVPQAPSGCSFFSSLKSDLESFPGNLGQTDNLMETDESYDASDESELKNETVEEESKHDFPSSDLSAKALDLGVAV